VERNTGSRDYQLGQLRYPREWGWPEGGIRWLDDFGRSGSAAAHRPSYQLLRGWIRQNLVGLVCVSDHSRLGRNAAEWLLFFDDCAAHGVLIAIDGKIGDPRDTNDRLSAALLAVLSEHGGLNIRDTLQHGRLAKLEKGIAVSYPPVGYDQGPQKQWAMTSDVAVRSAMSAVFRVFFDKRSLHATAEELRRRGVKVPRRKPGHPIRWRDPSTHVLADILGNPNYTPDYYYRRRVDDPTKPRSEKGRRRVRKAMPEEMRVIRDHHEGYIIRAQWDEIHEIFERNSWSRDHAPLGEGAGLVQGLPRCAVHRLRKLSVHYKRGKETGPRSHHYFCKGDWETCGAQCGRVPGGRLDDAVANAVLARLSPPSIAAVRQVFEETLADSRAERRRREVEHARLCQRIADLEAKLDAVGPDNQYAVRRLASQLQQAEGERGAVVEVDEAERQRAIQQDVATLVEAEALASDIRCIWNASATRHRDRKELIRIVVKALVIEEWGTERVRVRISWADGAPDQVVDVWLPAGIEHLVREAHAQGRSFAEIAVTLNEMGIRTQKGHRWAAKEVQQFLWRRSRRAQRP
jgi:DNA invertase Pin-like site-specific DNA recombinase